MSAGRRGVSGNGDLLEKLGDIVFLAGPRRRRERQDGEDRGPAVRDTPLQRDQVLRVREEDRIPAARAGSGSVI